MIDQRYTAHALPDVGRSGFHACTIAVHCWEKVYGYNVDTDVLALVRLEGVISTDSPGIVVAGEHMTIVRIFDKTEMNDLCSGVLIRKVNQPPVFKATADVGESEVTEVTTQHWYKNAKLHRDGGLPAVVTYNSQQWWVDGKRHRDGGLPASVWSGGLQEWLVDGVYHRDGGLPAVVYAAATNHKEWWVRGKHHRDGGLPAVETFNGRKEWWVDGLRHRDGGLPAVTWEDGHAGEYWCMGVQQ